MLLLQVFGSEIQIRKIRIRENMGKTGIKQYDKLVFISLPRIEGFIL